MFFGVPADFLLFTCCFHGFISSGGEPAPGKHYATVDRARFGGKLRPESLGERWARRVFLFFVWGGAAEYTNNSSNFESKRARPAVPRGFLKTLRYRFFLKTLSKSIDPERRGRYIPVIWINECVFWALLFHFLEISEKWLPKLSKTGGQKLCSSNLSYADNNNSNNNNDNDNDNVVKVVKKCCQTYCKNMIHFLQT